MSVENIIRCSVWISSKVDNSNKIHVQRKCTINAFFLRKVNEVEVHQYKSKLMVVHLREHIPRTTFFPFKLNKVQHICTQTVHFKTKHKMRGFENCPHKM